MPEQQRSIRDNESESYRESYRGALIPNGNGIDEFTPQPEQIKRLKRDVREASASLLGQREIRFLVDTYYQKQDTRKAEEQQYQALKASGEPNTFLQWLYQGSKMAEHEIAKQLDYYTDHEPTGMGLWCKQIFGIGHIITAGLLANVDITQVKGASSLWRYAGVDPTVKWWSKDDSNKLVKAVLAELETKVVDDAVLALVCERADKHSEKVYKWACEYSKNKEKTPTASSLAAAISRRPWNAGMKVLVFKIGDSFMKNCNKPPCFYGHLYKTKRAYYEKRSLAGDFRERAEEILRTKKIGKEKKAYLYYSKGELPPSHIVAMSKRWAAKLFLAHFYEESYRRMYDKEPALPYPIVFLGHQHKIDAPPPDYYSPQVDRGEHLEDLSDWEDIN